MAISPISNQPARTIEQPQFRQRMQHVADVFGMSTDSLMGELQTGKSLADIAQQRNISRDMLLGAVKTELGATPGTQSRQLDAIANRIIDLQRPSGTAPEPARPRTAPRTRIDFRA